MNNTRELPIKSSYNFRDLGGYIGADGRAIKWRKLMRSGDFVALCDDDKLYLDSIPLTRIVDFRSESEVGKSPDDIPGCVKEHINIFMDAGNLVPKFYNLLEQKLSEEESYSQAFILLKDLYKQLVTEYNSEYKEFFRILQESNEPLLFHCTAGKDRTGVAATLLLYALGVDKSVIFEDYLLTNKALIGKYDDLKYLGKISELFSNVYKEYLDYAFETINNNYGSVDNYLTEVLNVDIDLLRGLYLEE